MTVQTPNMRMSGNSTTTPLNAGASWTGAWVDVSQFRATTVAVSTDQNGTVSVQYSIDRENIDSTLTKYYRTNRINAPHVFVNARGYARVVFTNTSASNQSYIRLESYIGEAAFLNAAMDAIVAQDYDAMCVRPTDFTHEVALGLRQGYSTWNKFGYNADVDTTTDPEIIASWGGTFQYLTSGETLTIASSSTDDNGVASPVGTGAQSLIIYGLDENWDEVIEIVSLNGTTNVVTSTQWIGINRASVYSSGSGNSNAGTITITATSSGYTLAQMPAAEGTTQQLVFYVPRNSQFLATWLYFNAVKLSGGGQPTFDLKGYVYSNITDGEYEIYRDAIDTTRSNRLQLNPGEPFVVGEKSILWFTAETSVNDATIRGRFSGKLVRDLDG